MTTSPPPDDVILAVMRIDPSGHRTTDRLLDRDGRLVLVTDTGEARVVTATSPLDAVTACPELREVRLGQITMITADVAVLGDIGLLADQLVILDPSNLDDNQGLVWADEIAELAGAELAPFGLGTRALYINDERWAPARLSVDEARAIPVEEDELILAPLIKEWASLVRVIDDMPVDVTSAVLGRATPGLSVSLTGAEEVAERVCAISSSDAGLGSRAESIADFVADFDENEHLGRAALELVIGDGEGAHIETQVAEDGDGRVELHVRLDLAAEEIEPFVSRLAHLGYGSYIHAIRDPDSPNGRVRQRQLRAEGPGE